MTKAYKIDLAGNRYGRLVVAEFVPNPHRYSTWRCRCDCGEVTVARAGQLTHGMKRSCGCLQRETRRTKGKNRRHGMSRKPEYSAWNAMRMRCDNPLNDSYSLYGGRGITYVEEWKDFKAFYKCLGPRPSSCHSLDRIDSNGNYTPENCRWATASTQNRNRRTSPKVTWNGKTQTVADWADSVGISRSAMHKRLFKYGWDTERAMTQPGREYR